MKDSAGRGVRPRSKWIAEREATEQRKCAGEEVVTRKWLETSTHDSKDSAITLQSPSHLTLLPLELVTWLTCSWKFFRTFLRRKFIPGKLVSCVVFQMTGLYGQDLFFYFFLMFRMSNSFWFVTVQTTKCQKEGEIKPKTQLKVTQLFFLACFLVVSLVPFWVCLDSQGELGQRCTRALDVGRSQWLLKHSLGQ